jgi:hypothetical protein
MGGLTEVFKDDLGIGSSLNLATSNQNIKKFERRFEANI